MKKKPAPEPDDDDFKCFSPMDFDVEQFIIEEKQTLDDMLNSLASEPPLNLDDLLRDRQEEMDAMLESLINSPMPEIPDFDPSAMIQSLDDQEKWMLLDLELFSPPDLVLDSDITEEPPHVPDPNLTAKDAATWMSQYVREHQYLHHGTAVHHVSRYFGHRFTRINLHKNRVLGIEVLAEFLKMTKDDVVWSRKEKYWRMRLDSDPPRRRMVD